MPGSSSGLVRFLVFSGTFKILKCLIVTIHEIPDKYPDDGQISDKYQTNTDKYQTNT